MNDRNFTVLVKLKSTPAISNLLRRQYCIGRRIYNITLSECLKRKRNYTEDPNRKQAVDLYKKIETENCPITKKSLEEKQKELFDKAKINSGWYFRSNSHGFKQSIEQWLAQIWDNGYYKNNTPKQQIKNKTKEIFDSHTRSNIGERAYDTVKKLKNNQRVKFVKREEDFNTIFGKSNKSPIRYNEKNKNITNNGVFIEIQWNENDEYHNLILQNKVKIGSIGITRKFIRNRIFYYALIRVKGNLPNKNKKLGQGRVCGDFGVSKLAIAHEKGVILEPLLESVNFKKLQKEKRILQRKLDRQRRANNPNNYNDNGTCKKNSKKWIKSKRMILVEIKIKELERKITEYRKNEYGKLANLIRSFGDEFKFEKTSKKSWQKNWGKSIGNKAPGLLESKIKWKFDSTDGCNSEIDIFESALTQTCSYCGDRVKGIDKKTLDIRTHSCVKCGVTLDRDINAAICGLFWDKKKKCVCANESKKFIQDCVPEAVATNLASTIEE